MKYCRYYSKTENTEKEDIECIWEYIIVVVVDYRSTRSCTWVALTRKQKDWEHVEGGKTKEGWLEKCPMNAEGRKVEKREQKGGERRTKCGRPMLRKSPKGRGSEGKRITKKEEVKKSRLKGEQKEWEMKIPGRESAEVKRGGKREHRKVKTEGSGKENTGKCVQKERGMENTRK